MVQLGCASSESGAGEPPQYAEPGDTGAGQTTADTQLRFTDITVASGITFVHVNGAFGEKWMPETVGSGGGFLDYDGDSWPDIMLVNSSNWPGHGTQQRPATPRLYRNLRDGHFEDVTFESGLDFEIYGMGVAFADYDGDGDTDIYLTAVGDNLLLQNQDGRYTDVTDVAGVSGNSEDPGAPPAWSTSAAWTDVDRDGYVDLFVCNYVRWTPETDLFRTLDGTTKTYATPDGYQGESCRLYQNNDGQHFTDITRAAGVLNHDGKSLGVAIHDFNDDGWPDIVVANDTEPNFLYRNNGDGTFTDIATSAGVAYDEFGRARAGMGVDVASLSRDGGLAIAIGNFSREPVALFTQIGEDLFLDRAGAAGLSGPTLLPLTFGVRFADIDLDGYQDLLLANGHIEPEINSVQRDITFEQPPQLFRNDGTGRMVDISSAVGPPFTEPIVGRGLATSDIDRDGDLDILLTVNGGAPKLLRNDLPLGTAGWVRLRLEGKFPNVGAIGAALVLYSGVGVQREIIRTGSSYLGQSELSTIVFGLGTNTQVDSLTVRWPTTGTVSRFGSIAAGREYVISEGEPTSIATLQPPS